MKLVWQILNQGKNWTTIYSWVFLPEIEKTGVKQVCRILNLEKKIEPTSCTQVYFKSCW